jgi:diaminohydroxyphosphoribosylaminopyrimidine deaminase/5-amino-6-(5-phosphoribosylamino)uracil reductase
MRLALALAKKGEGRTSPNPMVGAVLVHRGEVIARGYHHRHGGDHAEVDCLKRVGFRAPRGATLYVTLEPCCHAGLTPPCTAAIIKSGVGHVVAASLDPNPQVAGKGIAALKSARLAVEVGVLAREAREVNRFYFSLREHGRPYVILKAAASADGKVGLKSGESKWITGEEARREAHRLRRAVDAVLVGIGTALRDDPELSVRHVSARGPGPLKIVIDPSLRLAPRARLLRSGKTLVVSTRAAARTPRACALQEKGAEVAALPATARGLIPVTGLLKFLAGRKILSVLVEGGPSTYSHFLESNVVDELDLFLAPKLIGCDGLELFPNWGIRRLREAKVFAIAHVKRLGGDIEIVLRAREKTKA